jgi:hypothetical protein
VKKQFTIAKLATTVYVVGVRKKHLWRDGNQQDIRKKLLVIVVGLDQGMLANCWYIMWMVD